MLFTEICRTGVGLMAADNRYDMIREKAEAKYLAQILNITSHWSHNHWTILEQKPGYFAHL